MTPELTELIRAHYWDRGHKVLLCAQDVAESLGAPASPRKHWETDLASFMSIDIVITPDSPPGSWRLVRHDHCTVHLTEDEDGHPDTGRSWVSHEDCTILGESP